MYYSEMKQVVKLLTNEWNLGKKECGATGNICAWIYLFTILEKSEKIVTYKDGRKLVGFCGYSKDNSKKHLLKEKFYTIIKNKLYKSKDIKDLDALKSYENNYDYLPKELENYFDGEASIGTLDANTWIENINLFGGIIKAAQDLAIIQIKPEKEKTLEEQNLLRNFDKIKQEEVSEHEKLEALLTLVIPEEDREIYRERYEKNSKLLEQSSELEENIINSLAKRKIDMSQIGRIVFLGEDGIKGEEYRNGVIIIEEAL